MTINPTPEERARRIGWCTCNTNPDSIGGEHGEYCVVTHIAAAIRAAEEACAQLADSVAAMYERNAAQGRYTADYRDGAKEAARHVAHLIRGGKE